MTSINVHFHDRYSVLNLATYIWWEKPHVIEYDKVCNGLKALSEILSIYSYIIINFLRHFIG